MTEALSAGRRLGAPARPRAIVATTDGVYLWPCIPLVRRQGSWVELIDFNQLGHLLGQFYGPQTISWPIVRALRDAARHLGHGAADKA